MEAVPAPMCLSLREPTHGFDYGMNLRRKTCARYLKSRLCNHVSRVRQERVERKNTEFACRTVKVTAALRASQEELKGVRERDLQRIAIWFHHRPEQTIEARRGHYLTSSICALLRAGHAAILASTP